MLKPLSRIFCSLCFAFLWHLSIAQPGWTIDPFGKEKKPEEYENKKLGSEKTADKKFTVTRRIIQNTVSHFNYYFNANNKLNAVIDQAKYGHKDDYARLLPFYPYSLDVTAQQKTELDSVIYKCTAGILLHDLRTDWVDNFYLLMGKSYFLKKDFDSATKVFQFINYNLFPRKKKNDDDTKVIGTNNTPGMGLSIADKEKRNVIQRAFTLPPSRNDALIWLVRTYTEAGEYGDAAGLINILQNDKNLPARLKNNLEEVTAYWFFAQENYDSAANHLSLALSNADTRQDKSRWEYLLAQLYEMKGSFDLAKNFYAKASRHTTNPVMDIYAQLNSAKMLEKKGDFKELNNVIANLVRMTRKDKYANYRDILFYSAAVLAMQKPDTANAITLFEKGTKFSPEDRLAYKNKSFLSLGDIAYSQKRYLDASGYYDSLQLSDPDMADVAVDIEAKRKVLHKLVQYYTTMEREDSLMKIASLPEKERDDFVKELAKKYRKLQGKKYVEENVAFTPIEFKNDKDKQGDMFEKDRKDKSAKDGATWYFSDASAKSRGSSEFKSLWGKRENVDNWRRKAAIELLAKQKLAAQNNNNPDEPLPPGSEDEVTIQAAKEANYSYEGMMASLPLSQAQKDTSNSIIASNLLAIATIFQNELMDYEQAVIAYIEFLERFKNNDKEADAYFGLYYCYTKLGMTSKAEYYKNIITNKYAATKYNTIIQNPQSLNPDYKEPAVTALYENIYSLYIEGKFDSAALAKQKADSLYGNNYWTPQLLYIEAVQLIQQKKDSAAIAVLTDLQNLYRTSPLSLKAANLIEVLGRRAQIETYLTNLEVTRANEEKIIVGDETAQPVETKKPFQQVAVVPVKTIASTTIKPQTSDSLIKILPQFKSGAFALEPEKPQMVIMIMDKVDPVYVNEAKNAMNRYNRGNYNYRNITVNKDALDADKALLVFSSFNNAAEAIAYYDKVKKAAPSEISWLQPSKYYFLIISDANLTVLKINKDIPAYRNLLNTNFGNKF